MNKLWISLKRGLVRDPKHRLAMGECIWLFEYMLDIADWTTGIISDWRDEAAADDMQMPIRTVREQRRKLDSLFYVRCIQKQHSQDIVIYKWVNPRNYAGDILNPVPEMDLDQGAAEESPSPIPQGDVPASPRKKIQGDAQGDAQGSIQSVTPTSDSKSQIPKYEEGKETIKTKTSMLLSKIYLAINPEIHGTLTISDEMRKKTPLFVLGWLAKTVHDTGRGMESPIGYLTKRLKSADEPDQYYVNNFRKFLPESYLESVDLARYICEECQPPRQFKKRSEYEQHKVEDHSFEDIEEIDEIDEETDSPALSDESILQKVDGSNLTPMQAWDAVLGKLSVEVPRATYDRLLRDTAPIRWDDFVMSVGVETAGNRDILEDRYTQTTQRLLVGILNADVKVQFVTTGG